jgi:hypothetical protein
LPGAGLGGLFQTLGGFGAKHRFGFDHLPCLAFHSTIARDEQSRRRPVECSLTILTFRTMSEAIGSAFQPETFASVWPNRYDSPIEIMNENVHSPGLLWK